MIEEWKVRQDVYHRTNDQNDLRDQKTLDQTEISGATSGENLISDIMLHFNSDPTNLIYPAKSYFVAVLYAKLLVEHFNADFYEVLDDPELLYGNDPHFIPYTEARPVYDTVLSKIGGIEKIDLTKGQCPDVHQYFLEEFLVWPKS